MKKRVFLLAAVITLALNTLAFGSVFIFSRKSNSLQTVLNRAEYDYINVVDYQCDLNLSFESHIDVQLFMQSGIFEDYLNFDIMTFEKSSGSAETTNRLKKLFDASNRPGGRDKWKKIVGKIGPDFYLCSDRAKHSESLYSFSSWNRYNLLHTLLYKDPPLKDTHLLAWKELNTRNPLSERDYENIILEMTLRPAP